MKVKDLLRHIEEYRKRYPDIDEWDVYTEQPELCAPEHRIPYEEFFKRYTAYPVIEYNKDENSYVVSAELDNKFYFDTEEEAKDFVAKKGWYSEEYLRDLTESERKIKEYESHGWKFITDSEGWVYRNTNNDDCNHTLFTKEKIFTINNNY